MTIDFGSTLAELRKAANLSQRDLCQKMHASNATIVSWEKNRSFPDVQELLELSSILDVPVSALFQEAAAVLPEDEQRRINILRTLSPMRLRLADKMLDVLYEDEMVERADHEEELRRDADRKRVAYLKEKYIFIQVTAYPGELKAAAGTGCGYGVFPEHFTFVSRDDRNEHADVIFNVSGPSMEPLYHDGDRVYVRESTTANEGDIVVAKNGDEGFVIKKMHLGKLKSVNKKYPFTPSDPDNVRLFGIVTGKVEEADFCKKDDVSELQSVFQEDIKAYLHDRYGWDGE